MKALVVLLLACASAMVGGCEDSDAPPRVAKYTDVGYRATCENADRVTFLHVGAFPDSNPWAAYLTCEWRCASIDGQPAAEVILTFTSVSNAPDVQTVQTAPCGSAL